MNNISKVGDECCGCMACEAVCSTHAIQAISCDGYLYPKVNKCIDCGQCLRVCPVLNANESKNKTNNSAYIAYINDENQRKKSTSGGIFFAIAKNVIQNGGVVYGAAYDDSMNVVHHRADTEEQIEILRGSKYVQSDIRLVFKDIIIDLESKKTVLFSGTPCQVSAIKAYCKARTNCEKLLLVEILCYGVPNPELFSEHMKQIKSKYDSFACNYVFRDERNGWGSYYTHSAELINGMKLYGEPLFQGLEQLYRSHYNVRKSCFNCHYIGRERCADITIGDCWGAESLADEFDSKYGVSCAFVNTMLGRTIWESIGNDIKSKSVEFSELIKTNGVLVHGPEKPDDYDDFWDYYKHKGYLASLIRYTPYGGLRYRIHRKITSMKRGFRK